MDDLTTWGGYLLAGALAPAVAVLGAQVLRLPGFRHLAQGIALLGAGAILGGLQAVRGATYAAGKLASLTLTKRLPKGKGQVLEDGLQGFLEQSVLQPAFGLLGPQVEGFLRWLLFSPFWSGLDADDVGVEVKHAAEAAVVSADQVVALLHVPETERPGRLLETAQMHARTALGRKVGKIGEKALKRAVERAVSRTTLIRAGKALARAL